MKAYRIKLFKRYPLKPEEETLQFSANFIKNPLNWDKAEKIEKRERIDYQLEQEKMKLHRKFIYE